MPVVDWEITADTVCEECGKPAEYDSELCGTFCEECQESWLDIWAARALEGGYDER